MSGLCSGGAGDIFALVAYLPEPIATFVNRLRHELSPGCRLRAHITVLPPRQLASTADHARHELQAVLSQTHAFRIEVEEVKVFPISDVVYLSLGAGCQQLKDLHRRLNQGPCQSDEVWSFQPHVTLAQDVLPDTVAHASGLAEKRWSEYAGPRSFTLDKLDFVQGSADNSWVDLASWELPSPVLA